jgi:hypothetical protein
MVRQSVATIVGLAAWAVACGTAPRIDTSSDERVAASLDEVRRSLPPAKRPAFDEALATVASSRFSKDAVSEMAAGPRGFGARVLEPLNGMTADEVLTEARRIVAEREAREETGTEEKGANPP